jgi:pimeloyl-ACP methyl ester carboxylesterase
LAENIAPAIFEMMLEFSKAKNLSYQDPATITLCGHSLGGALALNFSSLLWSRSLGYDSFHPELHQFRHGAIYTFGAPRIGKGRIWEFIRRPHYRLVVSGDPVPLSPPGFAADYEAAYLDKPANQAVQPTGSIQRLLKAKWIGSTLNIDISAHNIENYIEAIKKKIDAKMVTR